MTTEKTEEEDAPRVLSGVSSSQVMGGALAAVTAAVAGSWLGVAGTLIGAAVGSVVASIASTVYTNSLRRSQHLARVAKETSRAAVARRQATARRSRGPEATTELPAQRLDDAAKDTPAEATIDGTLADGTDDTAEGDAPADKPLISWRGALVATVVSLVLALGGILAYEAVVGHPLGNSDKSGTTFSNVGSGSGKDQKNDKQEQDKDRQNSDRPSDGATDPADPSNPSTTPEPSDAPTSEPTEETPPTTPAPTTPEPTVEPGPADQGEQSESDESMSQHPAPSTGESTTSPSDS